MIFFTSHIICITMFNFKLIKGGRKNVLTF